LSWFLIGHAISRGTSLMAGQSAKQIADDVCGKHSAFGCCWA
jgi:hypothetical protein